MTTTTANSPANWPRQAEKWLDGYGKPAWIVAMILGFILFWPVGLAILAYMIWGKKMFGKSCKAKSFDNGSAVLRPSGNSAFDAYKADMLRRLEDEQADFDAFLARLRAAKDKSEFDQFMDENSRRRREDAAAQDRREDAAAQDRREDSAAQDRREDAAAQADKADSAGTRPAY